MRARITKGRIGARRVAAATAAAMAAAALIVTAGVAVADVGPEADGSAAVDIAVDGSSGGRVFDGIGAISGGGATTRLLLDYPKQERDEVLDYLFKPGYGAALQQLKVEIGGDTNSTDGSESSHMHARGQVDCNAGYEWWLMEEAVKRNPDINLGALAWGAPGWLDGYYSQDTIDYFIQWLDCAARHGLHIDNMGVRNERSYDSAWIKKYRAALDAAGYQDVRIIASDEAAVKGEWPIAVDMASDPELYDAVGLLGNHYSRGLSSPTAESLNKPLWISEGGPWNADWGHGGTDTSIPSLLNHAYIRGRITAVQIWNLLTAYYDGLSITDAGLMRANTPWSGAYQVQSAIWAVAQTTQFTAPGWQYLDDSSGYFDPAVPAQGSYVSLKSARGNDFSTIIENIGTTEARTVRMSVSSDLPQGPLHVWQTTADKWFTQQPDLRPDAGGVYTLTIPANSTVTVTTTKGQGKGDATGGHVSAFPFPYHDSLADGGPSGQTPYFSQMEGAYEERSCEGGRAGTCLTQVSPQKAIGWAPWKQPAGVIGDQDWSDYRVSVDAYVPAGGAAQVLGRVTNDALQPVPNGYGLTLDADGTWSLGRGEVGGKAWKELATGTLDPAGGAWHRLGLAFEGDVVTAQVDGEPVTTVTDATWATGMAGLSGDSSATQFANLAIDPVTDLAVVDDAATQVAYAGGGWSHQSDGGRTVSVSNRAGDAAAVTFRGTQATLVGAAGPRGGHALLSVDGSAPVDASFKAARGGDVVWRSPVLTNGTHALRVEVGPGGEGNTGWVAIDRVEVAPETAGPSSIDDRVVGTGRGQLTYAGSGWDSCPGCSNRTGLYHSSVTSTDVVGDSVTLPFTGTSVDLYGLRATNQGIAQVLLDGQPVGQADYYGKVRIGNQLIWSSGDLTPGDHELTLVATGTKNTAASGTQVNVDRLVVRP